MKKIKLLVCSLILFGQVLNGLSGTVTWGSDDLGSSYSESWLVALYKDVDKDGWSTSVISTDGSTNSDDLFLGITTTLVLNQKNSQYFWGDSFSAPGGSLVFGDYVYSVLFNSTTIAAATQYKVTTLTDGIYSGGGNAWFQLPGSDTDATYKTTAMSDWQVIPEPATALLFVLGSMGAWLARRNNKMRAEAEA